TACLRSRPQRWRAWRSGVKAARPRAEDGGEKAWPEPTWSAESQPPRSVTWNCAPHRREGPLEDFAPWRTDVAPVSRWKLRSVAHTVGHSAASGRRTVARTRVTPRASSTVWSVWLPEPGIRGVVPGERITRSGTTPDLGP